MTLYMTDRTTYVSISHCLFGVIITHYCSAEDVTEAYRSGRVYAVKLYPAGATTNSEYGVTNIQNIKPVLTAMATLGMPLLVHGEVSDPTVDIFDREKVFIDIILRPLRLEFSTLKVYQGGIVLNRLLRNYHVFLC